MPTLERQISDELNDIADALDRIAEQQLEVPAPESRGEAGVQDLDLVRAPASRDSGAGTSSCCSAMRSRASAMWFHSRRSDARASASARRTVSVTVRRFWHRPGRGGGDDGCQRRSRASASATKQASGTVTRRVQLPDAAAAPDVSVTECAQLGKHLDACACVLSSRAVPRAPDGATNPRPQRRTHAERESANAHLSKDDNRPPRLGLSPSRNRCGGDEDDHQASRPGGAGWCGASSVPKRQLAQPCFELFRCRQRRAVCDVGEEVVGQRHPSLLQLAP